MAKEYTPEQRKTIDEAVEICKDVAKKKKGKAKGNDKKKSKAKAK